MEGAVIRTNSDPGGVSVEFSACAQQRDGAACNDGAVMFTSNEISHGIFLYHFTLTLLDPFSYFLVFQ